MPFQISSGQPTVPVPSGTYTATLESVTRKEGGFAGKGFRVWRFLADVNGELLPAEGVTSLGTGPSSKTYGWLTAITGSAPAVGSTVEDPIGKRCLVTVIQKDGYPRVEGVDQFSAPEEVMPGVPR